MLSHIMSQHYEWQKLNSSTSCLAVLTVLWLTAVNSVKQLNILASVPAFFWELILDHLGSWIHSHIVVNINYANNQEGRASKPASNCSCYQWRNRQIRPRPKKLGQLAWIFNSCRRRLSKRRWRCQCQVLANWELAKVHYRTQTERIEGKFEVKCISDF